MRENFSRFSIPDDFQRENLCYSDGMGIERKPDFKIDRGSFDNYLIMYVAQGRLWHEQYGEKIAVERGEYIFVNLRVRHKYYFLPEEPSCIWWVHLNGGLVAEMAEKIERYSALPFRTYDPGMGEEVQECFDTSGESMAEKRALSVKIYEILIRILESARRHADRREDLASIRFREQAQQAISQAVYEQAGLAELAEKLHLSKYHFCRTFQQVFGKPPMQYLMEEKLQIAQYHLLYTEEPVAEIARQLGFSTPAYFSRCFKEKTGVSPGKFRAQERHPEARNKKNPAG
ncbi:MAG: helix-turn-helix domain-containing protein [Candidatus Merdivicinus sp.]|jgi:AraC-like DNA-binding protein